MNMHINNLTPTARAAVERSRAFRENIAAKAAELADRKARLKLAAIPIAAVEAPLTTVPQVTVVASDAEVQPSRNDWFTIVLDKSASQPSVRDIQKVVCAHYGVTLADMLSRRRTANIVRPRQVAMYLVKTLTPKSLPDIARRFGGRDHTTALSGIRKIERIRRADLDLDALLISLSTKLEASVG